MIIIVRIMFVEYNDINLDFDDCGYQDDQIMEMIMTKLCLGANYLIIVNVLHLEIIQCRQMTFHNEDYGDETTLMIVGCGSGTGWGTLDPGGAVVP